MHNIIIVCIKNSNSNRQRYSSHILAGWGVSIQDRLITKGEKL